MADIYILDRKIIWLTSNICILAVLPEFDDVWLGFRDRYTPPCTKKIVRIDSLLNESLIPL